MFEPLLTLDPAAPSPLHRQLYEALRAAILGGRLPAGSRLPATRGLAARLAISRNTVLEAYAQLLAEGYVEGRVGSGTYVARVLPEDLLAASPAERPVTTPPRRPAGLLSRRGARLIAAPVATPGAAPEQPVISFRPGQPAFDAFPFDVWWRMVERRWRQPPRELLSYGDPAGYLPLREAIAGYLRSARAVRCDARQVVIVSGSQQALDLAARLLLDEGDAAWVEDPGYHGARAALAGAGARCIAVPIDAEGLDVAAGAARAPAARLAYVTPSHQYPLGVTMSLARRLALLEWAERAGAWVLEDDYDSEYRYAGRPLASLQGLDRAGRVCYVGTFSKVLFPSLRLGYLVAPPDLAGAFAAARAVVDRHAPTVEQAALADFIAEGHFARHIRRMRALYAERQAALVAAAREHLAGALALAPAEAGMHLVGWLPAGADDLAASARAAAAGVEAPALARYVLETPRPGGLLLGYTALDAMQIGAGVRRLAAALAATG